MCVTQVHLFVCFKSALIKIYLEPFYYYKILTGLYFFFHLKFSSWQQLGAMTQTTLHGSFLAHMLHDDPWRRILWRGGSQMASKTVFLCK